MVKIDASGRTRTREMWLARFAAMFRQPSWLNAVALATGARLCLNRRTVCAPPQAVDGAPEKGFSRLHRFLARGVWSALQGSRVLRGLPVKAFVPGGRPLVDGVEACIERRRGGKSRDKGIYRDPVRSSRGLFVEVDGLRRLSFRVLGKPGFARCVWGTCYARRWSVAVTFEQTPRHLGVETQRPWSGPAIHRTTPLLLGVFSPVTLWACELAARTGRLAVLGAAGDKNPDPTFSDCLASVRRALWAEEAVRPIPGRDDFPAWRSQPRPAEKPGPLQRWADLTSYAA